MPNTTTYTVLLDTAQKIGGGSGDFLIPPGKTSSGLRFNCPSDFVQGTNLSKPILLFRAHAIGRSFLHVHVNVNPVSQTTSNASFTCRFTGDHDLMMSLHEALNGADFNPGEENLIHFSLKADFGELWISDVILWYMRS